MNVEVLSIIFGFLGGAIITVIATLLIVKWQRQKKELSYMIEVRPFISPEEVGKPGARWDPEVKILYGNREISQIFPFSVICRNTGNQTLENLIIRLNVDYMVDATAEILNLIAGTKKGVQIGDINYTKRNPSEWDITIGFLNDGDQIEIYGIGTSSNRFGLMVVVPQPGVKICNRSQFWTSSEAIKKSLETIAINLRWPI